MASEALEQERELTPDEELDELDAQIIAYYTAIDDDGQFLHPPSTDDELYEFVEVALGFSIPRKVITPGHRAPFEFIADLFFERVENALGFANRSGGKTRCVSIINFLDMFFKPGVEVASAGAIRDQAKRAYNYFLEYLNLPWFKQWCQNYEEATGEVFVLKTIQTETSFDTGSKQEIITATDSGLRSPHPHKSRIDEVDIIPWETLSTGLSMAASRKGNPRRKILPILGQNVFTSTRQNDQGSMQVLLDEAAEKGIEVYEWNIWESLERCKRFCFEDPVFGDCPIYIYCQGRAHGCDGFYSITDFVNKVRLIDRDKWEIEWENKRPNRKRLVYWMFTQARHVMTPHRLWQMFGTDRPLRSWQRVSGIDFGSSPGHPFAYLKMTQLPNGAWLIFEEYVSEQRLLKDHAAAIQGSTFYQPNELIYSDWGAQERLELQELGVYTQAALKKDHLETGIDYIRGLLRGFPPKEEPMLYVWYRCVNTIKGFGKYRYRTLPSGGVDVRGKPLKVDDDEMDALRYGLYTFNKKNPLRFRYQVTSVEGL